MGTRPGDQPERENIMKRWALAISALVLSVSATGFACGPTGSTTNTTQSAQPMTTRQKKIITINTLGKQRVEERRIDTADYAISEFLGTKTYKISDQEAARRRKRDIVYLSYKKQLGNISNDELAELSRAVQSEIARRGR